MKCPQCGEPSIARHTLRTRPPEGTEGRVAEYRCPNGHRHVYALQLIGPIQGHGDGVYAVRSKIEDGDLKIKTETK